MAKLGNHWRQFNFMLDQFLSRGVKWIILINLIVFLVDLLLIAPLRYEPNFLALFAQNPIVYRVLATGDWAFNWLATVQFMTYMFIHISFWHLFFNMLTLWFFGPPLEHQWGTPMFLKFYLFSGFMAGMLHGLLTPLLQWQIADSYIMIGASGAIFAVLFAFAYFYPNQRILVWFVLPVPAQVLVGILGLLAFYNLWFGGGSHISHLTHLAGLGFGYLWLKGRQRFPGMWLFNEDPGPFVRDEPPPRSRFGDW
jgi:membrane associated rhomboid family serine protease